MLKAEQTKSILLEEPPFSPEGGFDNEEVAVEGKSAKHYGANQSQYVDPVVLP